MHARAGDVGRGACSFLEMILVRSGHAGWSHRDERRAGTVDRGGVDRLAGTFSAVSNILVVSVAIIAHQAGLTGSMDHEGQILQ